MRKKNMIGNLTNTTYISVFLKEIHDPLETGYYVVAVFLFILAYHQLKSCWKANNINVFNELYSDNKKIRERQSDARTQLRLMMTEIAEDPDLGLGDELKGLRNESTLVALNEFHNDGSKNDEWREIERTKNDILNDYKNFISKTLSKFINIFKCHYNLLKFKLKNFSYYIDKSLDPITTRDKIGCGNRFTDIYFRDIYKDFRDTSYHYEYLGMLVKYDLIPFKLVFDLITWPDDFWNESYYIRELVRKHWLPDFWENAEYLHDLFMNERIKRSILNNSKNFTDKNLIYSKGFILINRENMKEKELNFCKKMYDSHSELSAYQHMSSKAYDNANEFKEIANTIEKIGDDKYNEYERSWREVCLCKVK